MSIFVDFDQNRVGFMKIAGGDFHESQRDFGSKSTTIDVESIKPL